MTVRWSDSGESPKYLWIIQFFFRFLWCGFFRITVLMGCDRSVEGTNRILFRSLRTLSFWRLSDSAYRPFKAIRFGTLVEATVNCSTGDATACSLQPIWSIFKMQLKSFSFNNIRFVRKRKTSVWCEGGRSEMRGEWEENMKWYNFWINETQNNRNRVHSVQLGWIVQDVSRA